jgi:hypothetical protein
MFNKLTGLTSNDAVVDINAAIYVFHEKPIEGQRMMRATTAAYLLDTGQLFIGCSCASEGDQFTREKGRSQALAEAEAKLLKWLRKSPKAMPDQILATNDTDDADRKRINKHVQEECLRFLIDRFRLILMQRYAIINLLSSELEEAWAMLVP